MRFAMEEIIPAFTAHSGIECAMTVSSSGKLTAQIIAGAPYDVFVSADMKYVDTLHRLGLAESPKVYAYGRLVLWSASDGRAATLDALSDVIYRHIAVANPHNAPYGRAAVSALRQAGIYGEVEDRLVFGESISQVNQFIKSGSVDAGFTSLSTSRSERATQHGHWAVVPAHYYEPIAQGIAVLLRDSTRTERARSFRDFLVSPEATTILDKFGYTW